MSPVPCLSGESRGPNVAAPAGWAPMMLTTTKRAASGMHSVRTQRINRNRNAQCTVHPSGKPEHDAIETIFTHIVAHSGFDSCIDQLSFGGKRLYFSINGDNASRFAHECYAVQIFCKQWRSEAHSSCSIYNA